MVMSPTFRFDTTLSLAQRAAQALRRAEALLQDMPAARWVFQRYGDRGAPIERAQMALRACGEDDGDPALAAARRLVAEAEQCHWAMAIAMVPQLEREAARRARSHEDREDLIQDGYLALLEAARRFDPDSGLRFERYAPIHLRSVLRAA